MKKIVMGKIRKIVNGSFIGVEFLDGTSSLFLQPKNIQDMQVEDYGIFEVNINEKISACPIMWLKGKIQGEIAKQQKIKGIQVITPNGKLFFLEHPSNLSVGQFVEFHIENDQIVIDRMIEKQEELIIQRMARQCGLETCFTEKSEKEAKEVSTCSSDTISRVDFREEEIFTIDGDTSKDFDDAISLTEKENHYILGVHIADVSSYVKEDSYLDKEARKRGFSAYLLDTVYPMLPEYLSNGVCSLKEGEGRLTLSCVMTITKDGIIEKSEVVPSVICSKKRMTYQKVNKVLDGGLESGYETFSPTLGKMYTLAQQLKQRRSEKGAFDFEEREPEFQLDSTGKVIAVTKREKGKAEGMIQEFMLAANTSVASILKELNVVFPRRIHRNLLKEKLGTIEPKLASIGVSIDSLMTEEVSAKQVQELLAYYKGNPYYPVVETQLAHCMGQAHYSLQEEGHFALCYDNYLHFTSPIRRYIDLEIHRLLYTYYLNVPRIHNSVEDLQKVVTDCNRNESKIGRCGNLVVQSKIKEFLLSHQGETIEAMIKDCSQKGVLLQLKDCIEGMIPKGEVQEYTPYHFRFLSSDFLGQLGSKVNVKIEKKPFANDVIFQVQEPKQKVYV